MQKVALVAKEDCKLVSSIIIELYKSKLGQWTAMEKKQIKTIILDLSKIFAALPDEEIRMQKLDLSLAHEGIIRTLRAKEEEKEEGQGENLKETQEVKKVIEEFVQVSKLYEEILQGISTKYELNWKPKVFERISIDQVARKFRELKIFEDKSMEKTARLASELIEHSCN